MAWLVMLIAMGPGPRNPVAWHLVARFPTVNDMLTIILNWLLLLAPRGKAIEQCGSLLVYLSFLCSAYRA